MSEARESTSPPNEPDIGGGRPRIARLAVRNFRAFPGDEEFVINLGSEGKNLLLYGENGAGKSSLYVALQQLFAKGIYRPRYDYHDHLNIYTRECDGYVTASTTRSGMGPFRWEKHGMHPHVPGAMSDIGDTMSSSTGRWDADSETLDEYHDFARGVYLLDYKTLLRCSFPFDNEDRIDLADVLRLALYDYMLNGQSVAKRWHRLRLAQMEHHRKLNELNGVIPREHWEYGKDLGSVAFTFWMELEHAVTQRSSMFLSRANEFVQSLLQEKITIEFRTISKPEPDYAAPYVDLVKRRFELFIKYNNEQVRQPGVFLNEARMNALSLALFLSAAELCTASSPSGTKVLVLDDVLLSFDMSHRIPVLKLLQQEFADWQILLFTHDRVWYELARSYTEASKAWRHYELTVMVGPTGSPPRPFLKQGQDHLTCARLLLAAPHGDLMGAAVHIRAWFEDLLQQKCEKYRLAVKYHVLQKHFKADDFWDALKNDRRPVEGAGIHMGNAMIAEVEMVRSNVLNKLSHAGAPNLVRAEVEATLELMPRLKAALDG